MGFAEDLSKLCKAAGDKAELVVRKTALELQTGMVEMSPVDSGRLRGSFVCGIGALNSDTGAADASGAAAIGRTQSALAGWQPGQSIYLTTSLPYAKTAEYGLYGKPPGSANGPKTTGGYSRQAPGGFVRLTVQAYAQAVKKAVEGMK